MQAGLSFENLAHLHAIELLVALSTRTPDGGAARGIEQPELDADGVSDLAHDAAQRIDFADKVPLGHAANGRIAAHLRDEIEIHGDERCFQAHARCSHGRLAPRVAGTHNHNVVLFGKSHPILFYGFASITICEQQDGGRCYRRHSRVLLQPFYNWAFFESRTASAFAHLHEHVHVR